MHNWVALYFDSLFASLPLVILALGASVNLVAGSYGYHKDPKALYTSVGMADKLAMGTLLGALVARYYTGSETTVTGLLHVGGYQSGVSALALVLAMVAVGVSMHQRLRVTSGIYEFSTLVLFSSLGLVIMRMSPNLILIYLGRELSSQSLFVMAAVRANSGFSTEAGLKYFLVGSFASVAFLAGCANLYYATGSLSLAEAALRAPAGGVGILWDPYGVGVILITVGLRMKLGAAPLHLWAPDVYEGSPVGSSFFMVTVPKLVLFAMLWRFRSLAAGNGEWAHVLELGLVGLGVISILAGMLGAMAQEGTKRFLAFSGVNHMGFMLFGMATLTAGGAAAGRFYRELYLIVTVLTWGFLVSVYSVEHGPVGYVRRPLSQLANLSGFGHANLGLSALLLVAVCSMAGRPPFGGFFAKFQVLWEVVYGGFTLAGLAGVAVSVAATFYYLRVVKLRYFDRSEGSLYYQVDWPGAVVMVLAAGLLTGFMLVPGLFYDSAQWLAAALFARLG